MNPDFPSAIPEIPVRDINKAAEYYEKNLGFKIDWGSLVDITYWYFRDGRGKVRIHSSSLTDIQHTWDRP